MLHSWAITLIHLQGPRVEVKPDSPRVSVDPCCLRITCALTRSSSAWLPAISKQTRTLIYIQGEGAGIPW